MASNAAVSALLKPVSQHGRNSFPLDNKHIYSIKSGQISPIKAIHFEPKSYFDIKMHDFTLTFPMQTAPFLRARKETSLYSVYYNAIWSLFNQYQGTRNDPKTSAFGQSPNLVEPRYPLIQFYGAVMSQWLHYFYYEHYIDFYVDHAIPDLDDFDKETLRSTLKANYYTASCTSPWTVSVQYYEPSTSTTGYCNLTFNHRFDSFYNNDFYSVNLGQGIFEGNNITNESYSCDIVGHFRCFNWIRKADMLGYGNIYPLIKRFENVLLENMQNITGATAMSDFELVWANHCEGLEKALFDSVVTYDPDLGVPDSPTREDVVRKMFNLYPICAYNSVFYHFFRNSYYDLQYYTHDYSLDFVSAAPTFNNLNIVGNQFFSLRFWDIEYHQWKKDTFTAVLPDTQFGAVASLDFVGSTDLDSNWLATNGWINAVNVQTKNTSNPSDYGLRIQQGNDLHHIHNYESSFDVIALKRAEMLQEYRQQLMRAGNRTSDVFKAIYGSAPSSEHEDDVIPRFLDTFGADIFVDPVQSTANTGSENPNGQLGDIAARGKFRGDSPDIKFNAGGNFGVIIAFTYVVPTAEYNSYMFDKHVMELSPEDHFIPNFENLGLEPIMSDELNSIMPANNIHVLGFGPRYYHKKSEVDMVHGAFCSMPLNYTRGVASIDNGWFGDFNNWVSPRSDMQNRQVTSLRDFYINPSVLDNIFVRAAGPDQSDDQFLCNTLIECNSVKEMSKTGLINFV